MNSFDFDRESFDKIASTYKEARPEYNPEVYTCIESIKPYSKDSVLLEIGAGTGIATKEIADKWHSKIIAIEPGKNLREIAQSRLHDYSNVSFIKTTFENYTTDRMMFDGIFSATAFHWIDPDIKYKKAFNLLKNDGLLVLYWNNYGVQDEKVSESIQKLYMKYGMKADKQSVREQQAENIKKRKDEIEGSGLFHIVKHAIFENTIKYETGKYINLLKTFSDHSKEKVPEIELFFQEISNVINSNHGVIDLNIKINLEIAQKT